MTVKASLTTSRLLAPPVLLLAVAIIFCVTGANAVGQTTSSQPVTAALPPELIEIRSIGNEAFYNLDYATARKKFTELRDRLPQHPAGDLNLAVLVWMERLYKTRRLQTTLYTQEGFYAGGTKSKEGDLIEAGVDKAFRDHIAQAKTKAQKLVDRAPNDPKETTMSASVLVTYATLYGSTQEVAEAIATTLRECGLEVDIRPMREVRTLAGYSAIVLGAPLFMLRWHKDARRFLSRRREALKERPVAVFALGPVHDPYDEAEWQDSGAQLDKELAKFPWFTPIALKMFGGKYDPAKLRFPIKQLAGKAPASDLRDWTAIRAWAADLKPILAP